MEATELHLDDLRCLKPAGTLASIRGMQRVLRALETGSGEQEGSGREGRGGRDV